MPVNPYLIRKLESDGTFFEEGGEHGDENGVDGVSLVVDGEEPVDGGGRDNDAANPLLPSAEDSSLVATPYVDDTPDDDTDALAPPGEVIEPMEVASLLRNLHEKDIPVTDALAYLVGGTLNVERLRNLRNAGPAVELGLDLLWRAEIMLVESEDPQGVFTKVIEKHFRLADDNASGTLSMEEAVEAAHPCIYELLGPVAMLLVRTDLSVAYYETDDDHSGLLSITEFDDYCRDLITRAIDAYYDIMKLVAHPGCARLIAATTQIAEASVGWDKTHFNGDIFEDGKLNQQHSLPTSVSRQNSAAYDVSQQHEQSAAGLANAKRPTRIGGPLSRADIMKKVARSLAATHDESANNDGGGAVERSASDTGTRQRATTLAATTSSRTMESKPSMTRRASAMPDPSTPSRGQLSASTSLSLSRAASMAPEEDDTLNELDHTRPIASMPPTAFACFLGAGQVLRRALQALTRDEFVPLCTDCFRVADADKSGTLVSPEFEEACVSSIRKLANVDIELDRVMKLRDEVDLDHDEGLDLEEFIEFVQCIISFNAASMMSTMKLLAEWTGNTKDSAMSHNHTETYVTPRQMLVNLIKRSTEIRHDVTRDVCLMMTKKLADTMENTEFRTMIMENFAAADEGGLEEDEGCLNFKEFAPVVKDILRLWTGSTMDDKSLREYFEKFDRDNNRMLDEDEFVEFVEYLFVSITEYNVELAALGQLDKLREREAARRRAEEEMIKNAKLTKLILEKLRSNALFEELPTIDMRRLSVHVQLNKCHKGDVLVFDTPPEQYAPNIITRLMEAREAQRAKLSKMARRTKPSLQERKADEKRKAKQDDKRNAASLSRGDLADSSVYLVLDGCVRLYRGCADASAVADFPGSLMANQIAPLLDRQANWIKGRLCLRIMDLRAGSYIGEAALLDSPQGQVVQVIEEGTTVLKIPRKDLLETLPKPSLDLVKAHARKTSTYRVDRARHIFEALKDVRIREHRDSARAPPVPPQFRLKGLKPNTSNETSLKKTDSPTKHRNFAPRIRSSHTRSVAKAFNALEAGTPFLAGNHSSQRRHNHTRPNSSLSLRPPRSEASSAEMSATNDSSWSLDSPASLTRLALYPESSAPNLGGGRRATSSHGHRWSSSGWDGTPISPSSSRLLGTTQDGSLLDFIDANPHLLPTFKTKGFVPDQVRRRASSRQMPSHPTPSPTSLHRVASALAATRTAVLAYQPEANGLPTALPSFVPYSQLRARGIGNLYQVPSTWYF